MESSHPNDEYYNMDEFHNTLNPSLFRKTNAAWNELRLNDPWSVGYVSTLIESRPFSTKEAWEAFYYESGAERNRQLLYHPSDIQRRLDDFALIRTNPAAIKAMPWNLRNLNYQFGRTRDQLAAKGMALYEHVRQTVAILPDECAEAVRFRTICETWNGIILRERHTIATLQKIFPVLEFRKTDGAFDHSYAVDYELYFKDKLVCGIQIKPPSYLRHTSYIDKARQGNQRKNKEYHQRFGRPVVDVIATNHGHIYNQDVVQAINLAMNTRKTS
jgi:hypothetical protein